MQLKLKIYSLIKLYYKIVRNHTGIQIRSFKSVFFLLVLGILSFFFREEVLNNISDNTKLQYLLLIACIFNILFNLSIINSIDSGDENSISFPPGIKSYNSPYYLINYIIIYIYYCILLM